MPGLRSATGGMGDTSTVPSAASCCLPFSSGALQRRISQAFAQPPACLPGPATRLPQLACTGLSWSGT